MADDRLPPSIMTVRPTRMVIMVSFMIVFAQ
jgi:hypothetical protein